MKPIRIFQVLPALLLASIAAPAAAQSAPWGTESRVWFTGASNLRRFTCRADAVQGGLELAPGHSLATVLAGDGARAAATLRVAVAGLDCGIRAQSRHLRETLHAASYPAIEFSLDGYRVVARDSGTELWMQGRLAVAGVEQPMVLTGAVVRDADGTVRLQGAQQIRVTDFGVQPPRRFLGLLRVRDTVTVHYDVVLPDPPQVLVSR